MNENKRELYIQYSIFFFSSLKVADKSAHSDKKRIPGRFSLLIKKKKELTFRFKIASVPLQSFPQIYKLFGQIRSFEYLLHFL